MRRSHLSVGSHSAPLMHPLRPRARAQALGLGSQQDLYTLHVRRGDTVDMCDTSVAAVVEYMSCGRFGGSGNDTLIILTDETDEVRAALRACSAHLCSNLLLSLHVGGRADPWHPRPTRIACAPSRDVLLAHRRTSKS